MACAGGGKGDKGSRQREEGGSGEASSVVELKVVPSAAWLSPRAIIARPAHRLNSRVSGVE